MALGLGWRQECAGSHRPACSYWQTGPLRGFGTTQPAPRSWVLPRPAGFCYHPGGAAMRRRAAANCICAKQKFSEILHIYAKFPNLAKCWAQLHKVCAGAWLRRPGCLVPPRPAIGGGWPPAACAAAPGPPCLQPAHKRQLLHPPLPGCATAPRLGAPTVRPCGAIARGLRLRPCCSTMRRSMGPLPPRQHSATMPTANRPERGPKATPAPCRGLGLILIL